MARVKAPENETKAEAFKRLGGTRVQKAIDAIRIIGNLADGNFYEYTPEQIADIQEALEKEIIKIINKFEGRTEKQRRTFKL